jgi:hypothetical protein
MTRELFPWSRVNQEIPSNMGGPTQAHYRVQNPVAVSILRQMNPLCAHKPIFLIAILILSCDPLMCLPSSFTLGFPTKTSHACTCPACVVILDFVDSPSLALLTGRAVARK